MLKIKSTFYILIFILLNFNLLCLADNITTDRPDQSEGSYVVPKNALQIENGITIADEVLQNNFLMRYGVTNSTELRFLADVGKFGIIKGLTPITLGMKQRLFNQTEILPEITFVGYITLNNVAFDNQKNFNFTPIPFEVKLALNKDLSDKFSMLFNIATTNGFNNYNLTLSSGYTLTDKFTAFFEIFSNVSKDISNYNFDLGVLYLITPKLQIDLALAKSFTSDEDLLYTTFGIAYVFND